MKEVVKYVGIDLDFGFKGGFYLQNSIFRKIDFFFFLLIVFVGQELYRVQFELGFNGVVWGIVWKDFLF